MAYFRLTGVVTQTYERDWRTKDGSRSGTMPIASVEINDFLSTEVVLADKLVSEIARGDVVDLIVDVSASGNFIRTQAVNFWPTESGAHLSKVS